MKKNQDVYVLGWKGRIRTTIKKVTKTRATVEIDGIDVAFRLQATKGRLVHKRWGNSYREGVEPALSEIGGNRRIEDARETDRQTERSSVFELLRALEDRARGASLDGLRIMRKYLGDFL